MTGNDSPTIPGVASHRLLRLDALRGLALVAMTTFHFAWDLEFFGYAPAGLTAQPIFKWYARGIAFSFLLIAGFSFALSHQGGINAASFAKRLGKIAGAALLISAGTYIATPDRFVFFGILHQIAAGALISALLVRTSAPLILLVAMAIAVLPHVFRQAFFNEPWLWWTGLGTELPVSNDFVPVFPWTGYMLFGLALGKIALSTQWLSRPAATAPVQSYAGRGLAFLGRHSLLYYLLHQPALFGLLAVVSVLAPPDRAANFVQSCEISCQANNPAPFCEAFCSCVSNELTSAAILDDVMTGKRNGSTDPQVLDIASLCTSRAGENP